MPVSGPIAMILAASSPRAFSLRPGSRRATASTSVCSRKASKGCGYLPLLDEVKEQLDSVLGVPESDPALRS